MVNAELGWKVAFWCLAAVTALVGMVWATTTGDVDQLKIDNRDLRNRMVVVETNYSHIKQSLADQDDMLISYGVILSRIERRLVTVPERPAP